MLEGFIQHPLPLQFQPINEFDHRCSVAGLAIGGCVSIFILAELRGDRQFLALGIVCMFLFEPFKDNKMWRRVLSVAFGSAFVVWGLVSIYNGQITAFRNLNHKFHEKGEPIGFWIVTVLVLYLGIGCIYRGIRGKR